MANINFTKINPTGNVTILVSSPLPRNRHESAAAQLMQREPDCEQVGFLESAGGADFHLQMAGGEFCGNGTISAAAYYARSKKLGISEEMTIAASVSGSAETLAVKVFRESENAFRASLQMPIPQRLEEISFEQDGEAYELHLVSFDGISHAISGRELPRETAARLVRALCERLGLSALGLMQLSDERLTPLVYVRNPETLVWEQSCASGSTAAAAFLAEDGKNRFCFSQPGGTLCVEVIKSNGDVSSIVLEGRAELLFDSDMEMV